MTIEAKDQDQLRNYLLDRLDESEEEQVEIRLLTDEAYSQELKILIDEFIDRYAHEQISTDERAVLERFVLVSPSRRSKVNFTLALKRRALELKERKRRTAKLLRFYLPIAASVILVMGLGIWWGFFYPSDVDKGLAALRTAYRDQRPVEARITDFNYAPTLRTGGERVDSVQRDLATSLLTIAATQHRNAYSLRALGQYYITAHRFKEAVDQLEASVRIDPQNAKAQSDLGVAYLELGKQAQTNNDFGTGLNYFSKSHEHLKKAVELDESLLEARFNFALVLDKMGLPQAAEEAWRKYLEKDSSSKWADEARNNLTILESRRQKARAANNSQPLEDFLSAYRNRDEEAAWRILGWNREVIAGKFIPIRLVNAYLEAANAGRPEDAAKMLDALAYAGELEARKAGDLHTSGVASFYKSLSPRHISTLAQAHRLASKGYQLIHQSGFREAVAVFDESRRTFASVGNEVESAFVEYWLAFCLRYSQRLDESRSATEASIRYCRERNYKWLLAQALGLLSNIQEGSREQSAVLSLVTEALSLSEQVNDAYGTQKYLASLAGKYSVLYNFPESMNLLARCLLQANEFWPGTRQAWRNYDTATQVFNRMAHYSASAAYGEEALRLALEGLKDPTFIYLSHVHLGMAYGRLNNHAEGIRLAQSGFAIGQSMSNETGKEIMAYSALQLGELYRQKGDLKEAAHSYDLSIDLYDQLSFHAFKFIAHRGRLLTLLAQRTDAAAELELRLLLNLFEEYREKIKEEDNRTYFFDFAQEVYDIAIDFTHSTLKNDEATFKHSEESRARSLLALMHVETHRNSAKPGPSPYSHPEIRERMPEQVQILQFDVLSDKLLIWVISKSQFLLREKAISRQALTEQVENYLHLVTRPSSDQEEVRRASTALHETLIGPIQDKLIPGKTLCIVADEILNYLSFAALPSPASGRYLIEDHALLSSPSSSVFIVNTEAAREKHTPAGEKLLSVGNPGFDRQAFPSLPELPSAEKEAEAVANHYNPPSPILLTGRRATKRAVLESIDKADVLHFASHYVVDERWPMRSQLLLAKPDSQAHHSDSSDASLFAGDIYNIKTHKPRLAVLAACRTAVERYYNGEGMIGMARTFLAAGVPVVVASQWPVDTGPTSGLMIKFHEHRRRRGLSTTEALRLAQTEIIKSPSQQYRHPYYWAPFVTIGGYSYF